MANFAFRPAKREAVGLLMGLSGGTGSGKTFSALRLATVSAGSKPFAVIDTEGSRALHYADQFKFHHGDLKPPFSPAAYIEAIKAADAAGYPVIVIDSMSHEWAGAGGVLEMYDAEYKKMGSRETCKMAAWIEPKLAHKAMVNRLLQVRAHLILCFRAEPKIEMVRDDKGNMQVQEKHGQTGIQGWFPICEKSLPFEMTASFLLMSEAPGLPIPIKLQEQHRPLFPAGRKIDEEAGKRIAAWSARAPVVSTSGPPPHVVRFHEARKMLGLRDVDAKKMLAEFGWKSSMEIDPEKLDALIRRMELFAGAAPPAATVE